MKPRIFARTWAAIVRIVAVLGLLLAASSLPASAQDGPHSAALAKESVKALAAYIQETTQAHRRPDYSKPPISQYLQRILDADAFAALPPPQASDIGWLLEWNASISRTYKMLLFFGATSEKDMKDAMTLNVVEAEDQIVSAMALEVRIGSRMMMAMPLFMAALPPEPASKTEIRKAGIQRAQRGLVETVQGSSMSLTAPMRPRNGLVLSAALRDTAAVWAPFATAGERAELLKQFKQASEANAYPGVVDALNTASAAVSGVKD